jgi:hypothetical protein
MVLLSSSLYFDKHGSKQHSTRGETILYALYSSISRKEGSDCSLRSLLGALY